MKTNLLIFIASSALLFSCNKKPACANSMTLTATTLTPTVGDNIVISAIKESDNEVFQWNGPGVNLTNQSATLNVDNIKLSQSGIYYCNKANSDCNTSIGDSIVINVKLKQETPPCSPTNNVVTCSNIPNATFTSVTKSFGGTFNTINMYASGTFGYPVFTVLFNSYNGNTEPKDGTYTTTEGQSFNVLQEPNEISISFLYASNFYHCRKDKKAYVTHVNGKLQVTFCDLEFASPPIPPTTCSGKITQL
jgi:hypothetical protein